ncbi:hypothetical protein TNCV_1644521 [Trichonephila clavipes]|nr:hypothetical protein TNCV_1644521 [Trichonephila clavipes]
MRTLGDYRDLCVTVDVLFSDIFENFRTLCQNYYKIDPCNTYMVPGLEKTTQLSSRNEQLNSSVGTKQTQLVSRNETAQLCTDVDRLRPPTTPTTAYNAYNRLQPPATAYNRLQPPTTAYNRLQPPTTAYNRLQPPATACNRLHRLHRLHRLYSRIGFFYLLMMRNTSFTDEIKFIRYIMSY